MQHTAERVRTEDQTGCARFCEACGHWHEKPDAADQREFYQHPSTGRLFTPREWHTEQFAGITGQVAPSIVMSAFCPRCESAISPDATEAACIACSDCGELHPASAEHFPTGGPFDD
jgi:hypothetical protein